MKIGHIILSRMASERFCGKAMAILHNRPMLDWIIDKALSVPVDCGVCICATDDPPDQALALLAARRGILCTRGPEQDYLRQTEMSIEALGCTHYVEWSGDSPFADVRIAERIVAAMRARPGGLHYSAGPNPSGTTGIHVAGGTLDKLRRIRAYMDYPQSRKLLAEGWEWYRIPVLFPEVFDNTTVEVDIGDLFDQPHSLFSMCIDYPIQLAFFNRICEYIGHFPTWQEIEQAHREMRTL